MERMKRFNHYDLDGHALRLFLAVLEEGSVTAAATRLGLTQSAVSHALTRLRRIVRDPLFVRSGRGIVATKHAHDLAGRARLLVEDMRDFARGAEFDPATARLELTIAANDFQRDLLLPGLFRRLEQSAEALRLRVIPSGLPTADLLRERRADLLVTPFPPVAADIMQKRLFLDHYVCYYDAGRRGPPRGEAAYLAARHITVVYTDNERLDFDKRLAAGGIVRDIAISVPNFAAAPAFLAGTQMLASMPSLLRNALMRNFASVRLPIRSAGTAGIADLPIYMAWHQRFQDDPAHRWLRRELEAEAVEAVRRARSRNAAHGEMLAAPA
jgi:DNA-binding transcriptional LysR family regulator